MIALTSLAHAADNSTTTTTPLYATKLADFITLLTTVALPALASTLVTTVLGYMKSTDPKNFEPLKFLATLLLAFLISILTSVGGMSTAEATAWLADGMITLWIYWVAKVIIAWFKKRAANAIIVTTTKNTSVP